MAGNDNRSPHLPEMSGGIVQVIGEVLVDHGLRNLRTFVPSFRTSNFVPDEESRVSWYPFGDSISTVVIRVEKGGANDGVLGDNPVDISWIALGD